MTNIRPHADRVLIELIPDDRAHGDIVFADNVKDKYIRKGKVLAIANDCKEPLIPGQTVFAVWNCGVLIEIAGEPPNGAKEECRLFKSEDVWAVSTFADAQKKFSGVPPRDLPPQPWRRHA